MFRSTAILSAVAAALIGGQVFADQPGDAASFPAGIGTQKTAYGEALTDPRAMTLYIDDRDNANGKPGCVGACLESWTPLAAPRIAQPMGDWAIAIRQDGARQWAFKGRPLYVFAGDHAAGDVNGQGTDGHWHAVVVNPGFLPTGIEIHTTDYGPTFVTADGRTLYMEVSFFYNAGANGTPRHQSSPSPSVCAGECASLWTPLAAPADTKGSGDWSPVDRGHGAQQWAWKGHPLYTYTGDAKPGDTTGEGHWTLIGIVGTHWEVANIVL